MGRTHTKLTCAVAITAALTLISAPLAAFAQSKVYFIREDGGSQSLVQSSNDGSNQKVLFANSGLTALAIDPVAPQTFIVTNGNIGVVDSKGFKPKLEFVGANTGLAFDIQNRNLFFLGGSGARSIFSWNILPEADGRLKNPAQVYEISSSATPNYLAWDGEQYLFWSETRDQRVSSIKKIEVTGASGAKEQTVYSQVDSEVGDTTIGSIAYSQATKLLYLCQRGTSSTVQRLDPSLPEPQPTTLLTLTSTCSGIAIDDKNGVIYVSADSEGNGGILGVKLVDGSQIVSFAPQDRILAVGVEPLRPLSPKTVPSPPVLEVVAKSVKILMEKFVLRRSSGAVREGSADLSAAKSKPKVLYQIQVKGNGKSVVRTSKTNKYTLRGLKSGSYSAKYRVRYTQGNKQRKTKFTAAEPFTIQ